MKLIALTLVLAAAPAASSACGADWASDSRHAAGALRSMYMLGVGHLGGSGYVVDARGYLLTNDHVARRAKRLRGAPGDPDVRVLEACQGASACRSLALRPDGTFDESLMKPLALVVARDPGSDLALMRLLLPGTFPVLPWSRDEGTGGVMTLRANSDEWGTTAPGRVNERLTAAQIKRRTAGHEDMDDGVAVHVTDAESRPGHSGTPLLDRCDGGAVGTLFGAKGEERSDGETYFTPASVARAFLARSAARIEETERLASSPGFAEGLRRRAAADMRRALEEAGPPPGRR